MAVMLLKYVLFVYLNLGFYILIVKIFMLKYLKVDVSRMP